MKNYYKKSVSGELKWQGGGVTVIINPEKKHAGKLKDIDVIKLILENAKHEVRGFWMTPDEALEIAAGLSASVSFWLNMKFQPYMNKFNKRRNELALSKK